MFNLKQKNSKKQGDVGLGLAIAYFTANGYTVCVPLTDSQDYDLIVDIDGKISRVQVKTTQKKSRYNSVTLDLRTLGGNSSWSGVSKYFDKTKVEYIFAVTNVNKYLIPSSVIDSKSAICLGEKYKTYLIE